MQWLFELYGKYNCHCYKKSCKLYETEIARWLIQTTESSQFD